MNKPTTPRSWQRCLQGSTGVLLLAALVGCQVHVGGQTLPSPYWHYDDVQYFPPGNEFKLANEAAAMRAAQQEIVPPGGAQPAEMPAPPAAPVVPGAP